MITPEEITGITFLAIAVIVALIGWLFMGLSNRQTSKMLDEEKVRFDNMTIDDGVRLGKATGIGCGGAILMLLALALIVLAAINVGLPEA